MKYRSSSEVAGGERAGGIEARISYKAGSVSNHRSTPVMARSEEVAKALDLAIVNMARQVFLAVPVDRRTKSDTQFLSDCIRGRRCASGDTLARLLSLAGQADTPVHSLSDAIRAVEVRMCAAKPICAFEASQSETIAQGQLDQAQMLAVHEDVPVRWIAVAEVGRTHMDALRRVVDAAVKRASLLSHSHAR
jgi:hypothetical protein